MNNLTPWTTHRTAPYMRVSSAPQRDRGNSLDAQEWHLRSYYAEHGLEWPPDEFVFTDVASAWRDDHILKRPGFQRLLQAIRDGVVRGFCVFKWNRGFRNVIDTAPVYRELQQLGATGISTVNPYDIFTREGRLQFIDEIVAAEKQSAQSSASIKVGKAFKASKGESLAARPAFGISRVEGVDKWNDDAEIVRAAGLLYLRDGLSITDVALAISTPARMFGERMVSKWLRRAIYYGEVVHRGRVSASRLGALWSPDECKAIRAKLRARARGGRGVHASQTPLIFGNRFLRCAHCGQVMHGRTRDTQHRAYLCIQDSARRTCLAHYTSMPENLLSAQVALILGAIVVPEGWVERALARAARSDADDAAHDRARAEYSAAHKALVAELASERISALEFERRKRDAKQTLETALAAPQPRVRQSLETLAAALRNLAPLWRVADAAERRRMIRSLFAGIVVDAIAKRVVCVVPHPDVAEVLRECSAFNETTLGVFDVVIDLAPVMSRITADYALAQLGNAATVMDVADWLGTAPNNAYHQLKRLEAKGRAERVGKRGRLDLWQLRRDLG